MTLRPFFGARALFALLAGCISAHQIAAARDLDFVDHDDSYLYRLPYQDGVSFAVLQSWGSPLSHTGSEHFAVDFSMPEGTAVHAAREGIVVAIEATHNVACWSSGCDGYANFVAIRHSDGTVGEYFHLQQGGVLVSVGDPIARGQQIATSGNTGYSNIPHLHFAVYTTTTSGERRSIDIRFVTSVGVVSRLRSGGRYRTGASRLSVSAR